MFAIRMTFSGQLPPVVGWVLDNKTVATFPTQDEAEKVMNRMRRDKRYSWNNVRLDVAEYKEKR